MDIKTSAKMSKDDILNSIFFEKCPLTNEKQKIVYLGGGESGHKHLTVVTRGKTTAWKYTVMVEEILLTEIPKHGKKRNKNPHRSRKTH